MKQKSYSFLSLDTIDGLLFWHKYIGRDKCPTDWHVDEIYPWYKVWYWEGNTLDEFLGWIEKEFYIFWNQREFLKNELQSSILEKRDIIVKFPKYWDEDVSISVKNFDRDLIIKSLNGKKFGLEKWEEIQKKSIKK